VSNRNLLTAAVAVVLLVGGLLALHFPVYIDAYDRWGWRIECGDGYGADLGQAAIADQGFDPASGEPPPAAVATGNAVSAGNDYVGQCNTALAIRRAWAIPLAVLGWLGLSALAFGMLRSREAPPRSAADARELTRSQDSADRS
jgi:hypothetical protein